MIRRIIELENGKWSYQYKMHDGDIWEFAQTRYNSKSDVAQRLIELKELDSPKIKTIHEEI